MQRRFDRRHFLNALLAGTAAVGGAGSVGGCTGGLSGLGPTGAIGTDADAGGAGDGARTGAMVKVGLMLPLTATPQTAAIAKALQQAAELALFERPDAGLQLVVKDDKGTPEGAKAAADELIKAQVELAVGPLFGRSVIAVAPMLRAAGIPVIGLSNDPAAAVPGVFLLSFLNEPEVERIIDYAVGKGLGTFAALIPDDTQGRILEPTFRTAVERRGARVALIERYQIDQSGILEPSRKLREAFQVASGAAGAIDALFVPGGPDTLAQLSYLIGQAQVDTGKVRLLGTSGWDYANVGRESRLNGAWFAAPDPRGWRDFATRFAKAYGRMPPRLASLAFDALDIASNFARQPRGARYTAANLTRPTGFIGIDGPFRLTGNGRNERGLAVLEVQKSGPLIIDAAPPAFTSAGPARAAARLN
jgi:ABC-type branched-subunit amino acid transport system substrate-binding protein